LAASSESTGAGPLLNAIADFPASYSGDRMYLRGLSTPESSLFFPFGTDSMKTIACRQLGGNCAEKMSASSWDGMFKVMTEHVLEKHADVAKTMEKMHIGMGVSSATTIVGAGSPYQW
jgi:predicted small metal-binding protein